MKKLFFLLGIIFLITAPAKAQYKVRPNMPYSIFNTNPGFISINEVGYGLGLSGKTAGYSKHFLGFTSVNGYQVNKNFILGAGVGIYDYESGILIPLFLDIRYTFDIGRNIAPYIFSDGGILLNVSVFDATKLFLSPGIGARYTFSRKIALNLGVGILSQVDGTVRESFLNTKFGLVYKF